MRDGTINSNSGDTRAALPMTDTTADTGANAQTVSAFTTLDE